MNHHKHSPISAVILTRRKRLRRPNGSFSEDSFSSFEIIHFFILLKLTLSLFVLWIRTNDHDFAMSFDNFALVANRFY